MQLRAYVTVWDATTKANSVSISPLSILSTRQSSSTPSSTLNFKPFHVENRIL